MERQGGVRRGQPREERTYSLDCHYLVYFRVGAVGKVICVCAASRRLPAGLSLRYPMMLMRGRCRSTCADRESRPSPNRLNQDVAEAANFGASTT